jgi:Trypsin-co-occurring domain 2
MKKLELAEVIKALRTELYQAKQNAEGESIRFNVDTVDVEFETTVEYVGTAEAGGKIKFYVFNVDAKGSAEYKNATTHKIKLSLKPVDEENRNPETGEDGKLKVGGDSKSEGNQNLDASVKRLGGDS